MIIVMSSESFPTNDQQFYESWNKFLSTGKRLEDNQLYQLLVNELHGARDSVLTQLTIRQILSPTQTQQALDFIRSQPDRNYELENNLKALQILQDGHKGPLYKLQATLSLDADWASAFVIQEVLPWYTNHARQIIIGSDRPNNIKSYLIKIVNAHSDEMRSSMDF
jgi:hypothetical protein